MGLPTFERLRDRLVPLYRVKEALDALDTLLDWPDDELPAYQEEVQKAIDKAERAILRAAKTLATTRKKPLSPASTAAE